ncbi:hypothetical protein BDM02DRAFT_2702970 [Thelephora ganbajun]|uniref:Uncharacterized protein n=1 Tax=Thelephora ganbajun TaxID=370292 RepID=A0ACB6ZCE1_THEGA|nr:hypothetical protein BDM02DRAFT_2702970 [Thelephora ganbajun]
MTDPIDFEDLRTVGIVLFIVTSFVTSYRCFARHRNKLWWHDDSVALFSALAFVLWLIGSVILAQESSSREERVGGAYILVVGFLTPVWGARVSIILTLVRITPWQLQRKILLWIAVFFVVQYLMLTAQSYWVCEITYPGWKKIPGSICILPQAVPIAQVITTVISDAILITAPLMVIKGVRTRALRFRLFGIFSVSIATTVASLAHAVLMVARPGVVEAIFAGVEAAVSVMVCSMSVIIPAILRALGAGDPFMQEDTVEHLSTGVDIARMTSTRLELSLPTTGGAVITDHGGSEGAIGTVGSRKQRDSVCLNVENDQKHRLTMQASDGSLGTSTKEVMPLADESDIADSLALEVRSLPAVKKDQDVEAGVKKSKHNST